MKNIVLTRVDDRLLHGQVVVSWIPHLKAEEVIIIDDQLANDDFMQLIIKEAAPNNIKVHVLTVESAITYFKQNDENSKVLILLKNIEYIKILLEQNINLNKINLGNLGSSTNRKKYTSSVYLSDEEINLLKKVAKQIDIEYQMLPMDKPIKFE